MSDFKTRLRSEIEYASLLHKEVAFRANISKRTLDMYVGTRASMPPADVAVRLAKALGTTVEFLVTGEMEHNIEKLSHKQKNLLETFEKLSDCEQKAIEHLIFDLSLQNNQP